MITRIALRLLGLFAIAFLGVVAALYFFQRSLIYPVPEPDSSVPAGFEAVSYTTSDGLELEAGYRAPREGMPTLLFFHGNGVDWQTTSFTTELAVAEGYGVLAAEYRGYGVNPGEPSEQGLYKDGRAALDWLLARKVQPSDIVLVGNSLGSGVATELATQIDPRALVLVAPFKSMAATAANTYPWAPVDWLLHDRFDNIAKIGKVAAPVLVVHGEMDELIPLPHASELARAAASTELVTLPGLAHNMAGTDEAQVPKLRFLRALAN